jgi:hypothetical protein
VNNYYFSTGTAIFLTVFAASMWGSWMQVIKHRGSYPVSGIPFLLYTFSFLFIWIVTFILAPFLMPEGLVNTAFNNRSVIPVILTGGGMMSLGLVLNLHIMNSVGLLLSTAVSGAIGSILGIITSIIQEGMPRESYALINIIVCTIVFILAGFICNYAAVLRDRDQMEKSGRGVSGRDVKGPVTLKIILQIVLSTVLVNGWSVGVATGTAHQVPPILTCALMASGSFLSIIILYGIVFTVKKQWKTVFCIGTSKKPLLLSLISAVCHYGGNLISIYAMPVISATQSFLFGRTANVWTYFWGFFYREFADAKKRTLLILAAGMLLYFIGLLLLGFFNYKYRS